MQIVTAWNAPWAAATTLALSNQASRPILAGMATRRLTTETGAVDVPALTEAIQLFGPHLASRRLRMDLSIAIMEGKVTVDKARETQDAADWLINERSQQAS